MTGSRSSCRNRSSLLDSSSASQAIFDTLRDQEIPLREIGRRTFRVALHGLPYFTTKLASLLRGEEWDVRFRYQPNPAALAAYADDLRRCDLAYTWGGRISMGKFLWAARCLRKKKIVMLWSGSDVLHARREFDE